jgi:trehalose/maltose transport system permease protein
MRRVKRRLMTILRLALVGIIVLHALFPFYWAVVSSLKTGAALFEVDIIPTQLSLANYVAMFREQPFATNIVNSFLVALSTVAISVSLALGAAYALGRVAFRGRSFVLLLMLGVSMVSASRGAFRAVRAHPRLWPLQQSPGAHLVISDLHAPLHHMGPDHVHARAAARSRGGRYR